MRVFVTGGNGFIGSRVVRLLLAEGDAVRCLLRGSSRTARIHGLRFEKHTGDLSDFAGMLGGMKGCDAVIHLAALSSWKDMGSNLLEEVNVQGTRNLFEASLQAGIPRCVLISSAAAVNGSRTPVIFNETSPFELERTRLRYALSKHKAELLAQDYAGIGLPVIIVNPVEVYGPDDTDLVTAGNILDILKSRPAFACTGGTGIAHVDDVADGIVRALKRGRPGERYILGGDNLTIEEIVRLTLRIAGRKQRVLILPNALLRWSMGLMTRLGLQTPASPAVLDYATRFFFMDSAKAERELGYKTRSGADVLTPVVDWLGKAGYFSSRTPLMEQA